MWRSGTRRFAKEVGEAAVSNITNPAPAGAKSLHVTAPRLPSSDRPAAPSSDRSAPLFDRPAPLFDRPAPPSAHLVKSAIAAAYCPSVR